MIVYLNGKFMQEDEAKVSILDRGFLYGDGVFETLRVYNGKPFLWKEHLERMQHGIALLQIEMPLMPRELLRDARELLELNGHRDAILRVQLTRGIGVRGFSPRGADSPTLVMKVHLAPDDTSAPREWDLVTAQVRVHGEDPLVHIKSCNRLVQVLAKIEADKHQADDALMLNVSGEIAECASANIFWIRDDVVCTPLLSCGALSGVTRQFVLRLCRNIKVRTLECSATVSTLRQADGVFATLSTLGIVEVMHLDGLGLHRSELTQRLWREYQRAVRTLK